MATKKVAKKAKAVASKKPAPTKQKSAAQKKKAAPAKKSLGSAAAKISEMQKRIAARRPAPNDPITMDSAEEMMDSLKDLMTELEEFAAHMRPTDRQRHNGVGIERRGFIDAAYLSAFDNEEFLPHWVEIGRFKEDIDIFDELTRMIDVSKQITEIIWNLIVQAGDMAYTNALDYYRAVRDAATHRVDASETIFKELRPFFKSRGNGAKKRATERQFMRDAKGVYSGKKEGKIVIENISPKLSGGKRKRIDKTFKKDEHFEEDIDADEE